VVTKNRRSGNSKFSQDLIDRMLVWWVQFDGNNQTIADEVSKYRGKKTSRKTVREIAIRENFVAKAPMLKARVDEAIQSKYNTGLDPLTAEQIHFTELGVNLLTIDISIINQAKRFIQGDKRSNTPFKNMGEVISSLKFVFDTIPGMIGQNDKDIRRYALHDIADTISARVAGDLVDLLEDLPEDQSKRILARVRKKAIEGSLTID
jgi:hypothetical protein